MPSLLHGAAGGGGRGQPATGARAQARYDQAPNGRRLAGEITCDGGTTSLSMSFYRADPVLHPGGPSCGSSCTTRTRGRR
ncbi:hypothetical protein [Micromonospora palomenae]|uniref:hypothetical protein n=1 Tax=Micromonospora palomenae TaxID=1461247 RepID=UPI0012B91F17|nr:hypothetical protein [Micromonospora palomenae]